MFFSWFFRNHHLNPSDSKGNARKAVSQVENYIFYANRNSLEIKEEIKKKEGMEIKVVRPRGFIIAGTRSHLKNEAMEDGLRLLNDSLKNIEIILYDDLLNNLKNLLERLRGKKKKVQK